MSTTIEIRIHGRIHYLVGHTGGVVVVGALAGEHGRLLLAFVVLSESALGELDFKFGVSLDAHLDAGVFGLCDREEGFNELAEDIHVLHLALGRQLQVAHGLVEEQLEGGVEAAQFDFAIANEQIALEQMVEDG